MTATETKDTILDSAEQLFSEQGFASTSLRAITARAGVNLAAVNYHFGSKADLAREVLSRRLEPLNRERLRLLDASRKGLGEAAPPLEDIVGAFVGPALNLNREAEGAGEGLKRLLGRVYAEQPEFLEDLLRGQFGEMVSRFSTALERTLPDLDRSQVFWRMHFMVGAMAHTLCCSSNLLHSFSKGHCDPTDIDRLTDQLVAFVSGGLRAPVREEAR